MRATLIVAFWMSQVTGVLCQTQSGAAPNCLTRLTQETLVGDSITLITSDNTIICGVRPIVNSSSSILHLRMISDLGIVSSASIPFEKISSITYRKPSSARGIITLLGLGVGCVAGVMTGVALADTPAAPFDFKSMEFDSIAVVFFSGMIGALIGASGGNAIGKRITVKVTLECL